MKKNFSINLYGELYDIDEDAYETLDKYLKSMNRYFKKRKGEEENGRITKTTPRRKKTNE